MRIIASLFGIMFGLVFIAGGVFISLETAVPTFQTWDKMQRWTATTATLIKVTGASNTTEASYRYLVSGVEYVNDRVYVSSIKDDFGQYHQDMYQNLLWLKNNNRQTDIWYNPDNPSESVIDRDMRWGLFTLMTLFCSMFILIGLGISYVSINPSKQNNKKKPSLSELRKQWRQYQQDNNSNEGFIEYVRQQHSEEINQQTFEKNNYKAPGINPWLSKKEWHTSRIRSGAKKSLIVMWGVCIFWNAVSSPVLFVLEDEIKKGNYAALIALLFPLVGLFLIKKSWQMTREWNRYGIIEFEMDPFPGSIGGHVGGSLLIKNVQDYTTPYQIELECVYSYVSGSGDNRSRRENIKWAEGGRAKVVNAANGVILKCRFDVPEHLPESNIEQQGDYYFWRLKVSADLSGIQLNREYNIPVFKTQTESKYIRHDVSAQVEEMRENKALESQAAINSGDFASTALARAFKFKDKGRKQVFYFPMFRNKVLTFFALIFVGGFDFAAYSITDGFGDGSIMSIGMFIFSIPFALVGLIASIATIYLSFNNLTTILVDRKIKVLRRLFIFPVKYSVIEADSIKKIEIKSTGSTGEGVKQIKHYKLISILKTFKKVTIAEDIDGEDLANQLKEFICKRLFIDC